MVAAVEKMIETAWTDRGSDVESERMVRTEMGWGVPWRRTDQEGQPRSRRMRRVMSNFGDENDPVSMKEEKARYTRMERLGSLKPKGTVLYEMEGRRRFHDRSRPVRQVSNLAQREISDLAAPLGTVAQRPGHHYHEEFFLGDGDGYLSDDFEPRPTRRLPSFRGVLGPRSTPPKKAQPVAESRPLVAVAIFDDCRCVRVTDTNSLLLEYVPSVLSREVYDAHAAYRMATHWGQHASARKYLNDLQRQNYKPLADGSVVRVVRVRMRGVTAPRRGEPFHLEALKFLQDKVSGNALQVVVYWKDSYGRAVGDVILAEDRIMVNLSMLKAGLSWHTPLYDGHSDLVLVEKEARRERVGLWAQRRPAAPW